MASHFERTTKYFREFNVPYQKVEYYNTWARKRIDLFNIIDLIALDFQILGVQVCGPDVSAHKAKMRENYKYVSKWISCGGALQIFAWRKLKAKRGGKLRVWKPRIIDVLIIKNEIIFKEKADND